MGTKTVDVIIPTLRPDNSFRALLEQLDSQSVRPDHILIINTGEEDWNEELTRGIPYAEVFHITKKEFDHAATRNMGAGFSNADYLIFMTQDALPADRYLIERLTDSFDTPLVRVSYARQLPKADSRIAEAFVRIYNYPEESRTQKIEDTAERGIKAFFCSDVCACYERGLFTEMQGFSPPAIFNEDMVYAGRIMNLGYCVRYAADAMVYHSHNYSLVQQFRRNFDNGVSQAMHPEIFGRIRSEGEGVRMVKFVTGKLRESGRLYLIPGFYAQCAARLIGFRMGKGFRKMPRWLVRLCSSNREFWKKGIPDDRGF